MKFLGPLHLYYSRFVEVFADRAKPLHKLTKDKILFALCLEQEVRIVIQDVKDCFVYEQFKIRTNYTALKWLLNSENTEGQIARSIEILQQYDFEIKHRHEKTHQNADALSRLYYPEGWIDNGGDESKKS